MREKCVACIVLHIHRASIRHARRKCNDSIDPARILEIIRNIVYRLGSCGLWCYSCTNSNACASEYIDTNSDGDTNTHAYPKEYGDGNRDSNSNANFCDQCCNLGK